MEIMKPLAALSPLFFGLFSPLLFAANPDVSPGDLDRVTGSAIIHEINTARQNPRRYATLLEQIRQDYAGRIRLMPGSVRLCTHEGVRAVDEAIRFLRSARPLPALALSQVCVWPRRIIAVSRLVVLSDITVATEVIRGAGSVVMA